MSRSRNLISANLSTSTTTTRTATSTASSTAPTTHTIPAPNRDPKIALGVGLGVALPLFVVVLVMGALLYLRKKNPPGLDSDEAQGGSDPDNEARGELEEQHNPHELKANSSTYELTAVVHEAELDVEPVTGDEGE
ncbi:MAG: hypothetical protein M1839_000935 [Geoglossum umbratile]|nr:MAG: hypothetical protein M1839_000935 [Geoglossum umbratile]